ncbi:ATP-binding protein [Leptolyngbya sp. FACHB-261]|uniref:ATP-binding protein n=1 Tax=Leptolyngbya sp. FACHB-261 TaxID=2692806 RepID=UPI0016846CEB|nr:ATP-binding protein [Leptolyngbya sp. FACHB-261]MBD2103017.1 cyclic nucleotide-binding domain-containing protein [Leptolyngbya sp. FACHB-261]
MLHDPSQDLLFPKLSPEELQRLSEHGQVVEFNSGDVLFSEGDPLYQFYVVLEGQVQVTKQVGGEEQTLVVHQPGEFTGEISMITGGPALATARSLGSSRVLEIKPDDFKRVLAECSQGAAVILAAMAERSRDVELQLRQKEKLAALGKLSAGLAHELNNPAAAGRRAAQQLREAISSVQARLLKVCEELFPDAQRQLLIEVQQEAMAYSTNAPRLDPLTQSDREDALSDWLDEHDIGRGWELAPVLVSAGVSEEKLTTLADQFSAEALTEALNWLIETLTLTSLVNEVEQSTSRISQLVKAIKSYSYMDQAPLQEIDIHDGLENTLTILNHKLKYGITLKREYAPSLPTVCAYGSELNQVWTNLLDNAIYAMGGKGEITIHTALELDQVVVEIADNGPGIPVDIQSRIFDPFFTTKGVGEGTGLGLDIARRIVVKRHHGELNVNSKPGRTCFQIRLPLRPPKHPVETCTVDTHESN